jgi:hypothetical protein
VGWSAYLRVATYSILALRNASSSDGFGLAGSLMGSSLSLSSLVLGLICFPFPLGGINSSSSMFGTLVDSHGVRILVSGGLLWHDSLCLCSCVSVSARFSLVIKLPVCRSYSR